MSFKDQAQLTYNPTDIYLIDLRLSHMLLLSGTNDVYKKFKPAYELFSESYSLIYDRKLLEKLDSDVLPHVKTAMDLVASNQELLSIKRAVYTARENFNKIKKDMAMVAFFSSTQEAMAYGKAHPEERELLLQAREKYLQKYERIIKKSEDNDDLWNLAMKFATQAQFFREAYQAIPNGSCFYAGSEPIRRAE